MDRSSRLNDYRSNTSSIAEPFPDVGRNGGNLRVEAPLKDHRADGAKRVFDLIEVLALDREHALFQFHRLTTVLDGEEVGSRLVHPDPRRAGLLALDHLPDVANLLVDPANQLLPTLDGRAELLRASGGDELEFHGAYLRC